ncbi:hypothetical protein M3B46_03060 [Sphingobacterium daejeonense]|uniref:hypothetical protein n=1 Tax=Sphingobacterium daejeonense TaxID=371142 RepID=UPI0021A93B5A|nr:hypothetical protein [Sphingobacterium daejeonense]MCT1529958.1 hypothetical protein [Sphingobacterium daejeonense]
MEVNMDLNFLKHFEFATVRFNDIEYLKLSSYSNDLLTLSQLHINEFEAIYERELLHLKSIFIRCFNSFAKSYNDIIIEFNNCTISFEELKRRLFIEMTFTIDQNQLFYNFITKNIGIKTLYLFDDFLDELYKRIEEINDVYSVIKPYQQITDNDLSDTDTSIEQIEGLENLTSLDWHKINFIDVNPNDLKDSNIIKLNPLKPSNSQNKFIIESKITFDEAIRPEAQEEFEKWYKRFCIDEPETDKLEAILFFKLMNIRGYFIKEFNIEQLHQITIDRTNRQISINYFKNNGRKKFEDWLDGKPIIPTF